ncbi:MAG TPA: HAD-IA family hydrolase [Kineosporiaceae bacterium]|nr:HAD-IA family hydrolase [Kineosporiaceae bacterium]
MSPSSIVVFDLGEVLVPSAGVLPRLAAEVGVSTDELSPAYWRHRRSYDLGGDEVTYWESVVSLLGREPDPLLIRRLSEMDAAKWSVLPAVSQVLLDQLTDVRLGLLSNAPAPLASSVRAAGWTAALDVLVFSADLGLAKPDPQIYVGADTAYETAPADVVFFDDRPDNVAAARTHGWDAHLWVRGTTAADVLAVHNEARTRSR